MTFDKELLFKSRLTEADVDVPGLCTVRVRALTRKEAMGLTAGIKSEADATQRRDLIERRMLALAIVALDGEAASLTEAEIGQWQEASPAGELEPVTDKVNELSAMTEGAANAAYKEFESDPDGEFRLPPG